jgi:acetyltransferase-like isoleucine patch superfamily enzyme
LFRVLGLIIRVLFSPVFWRQTIKHFRFFIHNNVLAIPKLAALGDGSTISPTASLAFPENIHVGKGCLVNHNVRLYAGPASKIILSDGVMIGPDVFVTSDHFSKSMSNTKDAHSGKAGDVFIDKNVRVGAHCIILPGVSIGKDTTVGAGSVVTKDIPANVIVAGNPAGIVKQTK